MTQQTPLTDDERTAARMFSMSDAEYLVYRDGGNASDIEHQAELTRKAAERVDEEQAVAAERARRMAA